MTIFGVFFSKKNFQNFFFQKLKNTFLIDPEWSILAKGKVAISKTVATAAFGYIIYNNTYQPNIRITTEFVNGWVAVIDIINLPRFLAVLACDSQ